MVSVNFVRDRQDADVYIKMYSTRTGGGGTSYKLEVEGKKQFSGIQFAHEFLGSPITTDKEQKELFKTELDKILIPFWLHSGTEPKIEVQIESGESTTNLDDAFDPWNSWVFRLSFNGNMNGEELYNRYRVEGRINASRITEESKFFTGGRMEYEDETFIIDESTIHSFSKNWSSWFLYVRSISDHWSIGSGGYLSSSTYSNYDIRTKISAAIEYNVFPYQLAAEKQFSFLYKIGPAYHDYTDTTVFNKVSEFLLHHSLDMQYEIDEDWGSAQFNLSGGNYLHDWDLFNLSFSPVINWNIFKGFSVHAGAHASWIRDQINLPKISASSEQVLLQIRQLQTNYSFGFFGGISYRFGSDNNNVVNRRFDEFFD